MYSLTWLPDVLRGAGLPVVEIPGWQTRGHGDVGQIRFVMCHHTACNTPGDHPSLETVMKGRPDLAGPLSQLLLSENGTYYVIAAGKAWHAGSGVWHGMVDGNSHAIGIEAENNGTTEPWPVKQMDAYAQGVAAILKHIGAGSMMCAGHKEYALPKGRKIDPDFDMMHFRQKVASYL